MLSLLGIIGKSVSFNKLLNSSFGYCSSHFPIWEIDSKGYLLTRYNQDVFVSLVCQCVFKRRLESLINHTWLTRTLRALVSPTINLNETLLEFTALMKFHSFRLLIFFCFKMDDYQVEKTNYNCLGFFFFLVSFKTLVARMELLLFYFTLKTLVTLWRKV